MTFELAYTEKELLQLAARGNEEAFTRLFHQYKHKLYSYILRLTQHPEMTEDVIQNVFMKLWNNRTTLGDIEQFSAYIFRMSQNQVINAFKRMAKETIILAELQRQPSVSHIEGEENLALREVQQKLHEVLEKLTPQQKLVYTLSREEGLKHEEKSISPRFETSEVRKTSEVDARASEVDYSLASQLEKLRKSTQNFIA